MPDPFDFAARLTAWQNDLTERLRDPDAAAELATHVRELFEASVAAGRSDEEAWQQAVAATGDVQAIQREFAKLGRRWMPWVDGLVVGLVGFLAIGVLLPIVQAVFVSGPAAVRGDRLLGWHVAAIALGYLGALGCELIGAYAVLRLALGGATNRVIRRFIPRAVTAAAGLEAVLLLVGILLGAVWASEHRGRAWSWDLREVGAVVTMLFHAGLCWLACRRKVSVEMLSALATIGGTLTICAWFGPLAAGGGLHGYGPPAMTWASLVVAASVSAIITALAVRRRRQLVVQGAPELDRI